MKRNSTSLRHPLSNKSFQQISIDLLEPYAGNPKTHSSTQINALMESMKAFGFVSPIVVGKNNVILAGHARYEAARQLGYKTVPIVHVRHLSPEEERAYRIADNRLSEKGAWDDGFLKIEFGFLAEALSLGTIDFGLPITGFETAEIDLLLALDQPCVTTHEAEGVDTSALLAQQNEPRFKHGDLVALGDHRVFCGSALDVNGYNFLMNGKVASLLCTDPPYNVSIGKHVTSQGHREFVQASGEMSYEEFKDFLALFLRCALTHLREGSLGYICMDWRHDRELQAAAALSGLTQLNLVIWNKGLGGMGSLYRSQHELIYVYRHGKKSHKNNVMLGKWGRNRTNVWDYPSANMCKEGREALKSHPTPKPTQMIADLILDCTEIGDVVLDPFLGSGTTVLAAEKTSRICYGTEIDPAYVDLIVARWEAMTGKKAVLLGNHAEGPKGKRVRVR